MRYLTISHLQEGMVLAQPFYGSKFEILLTQGTTLSAYHIQRINELGYAGVYILDDSCNDVVAKDIISSELRIHTMKTAKDILVKIEAAGRQKPPGLRITNDFQQKLIMPIIEELISSNRRIIDMIDLKPFEYYNYYHAANVVVLSLLLGLEHGVSGQQLYELGLASLLYDVGNVFVPKAILNKPDKLTPEEYDVVKGHTEAGFEYLREQFGISIEACMGALHHHEYYDGTGYPNGLKKQKISIYGRIIAITDAFDALTSRRPFREPMFPLDAMQYLQSKAGMMFDPELVESMWKIIAPYPAGVCVELNSGVRCMVVENFPNDTSRPKLRLLNGTAKDAIYLDLHSDKAFKDNKIIKILDI